MAETDEKPGVAPAAPTRDLQSKVRSASLWLLGGTAASHLIRFLSNIALTRVLPAETFGLMALVQVFLQGLQLFSDIGIGPAIIQSKHGNDPNFLNTAFTLQVMRGALLFGVACIGAAPFAALYGQSQLAYLLPVAGINSALLGFRSSKTFMQNRELTLGRLTFIEFISQTAAAIAMVALAYYTRSIWALVAGGIVRNLIYVPAGHLLLPGVRNRLHWNPKTAKGLLVFGQWVFVSTAMTFIAGQADRLIFGRLLTLAELGVYSIAVVLASTPSTVLTSMGRTLVFPIYSRAHQNGGVAAVFPTARWPLLVAGGFALSTLACVAPSLVHVLYKPDFWAAGWLVQLLTAGIWLGIVLSGTNTEALMAQGLPRWSAVCSLVKAIALFVFLPLGFALADFPGAVAGLLASDLCRYLASLFAARRRGLHGFRQDLRATAIGVAATGAGLIAIGGVHGQQLPGLFEVTLGVAVVTAVWSPWLLPFVRPFLMPSTRAPAAMKGQGAEP